MGPKFVEPSGRNLGRLSPVSQVRKPEVPGQVRRAFTKSKLSSRPCGSGGERSWRFWPRKQLPICSLSEHVRSASGAVPPSSSSERSCGCLHDNSRNCVSCCAPSQMLLCTCGLIRWHFFLHKRLEKFCMVSMSKMRS